MDHLKVGIHQPNFVPWLGYFTKIQASDRFILLDDVQYTKNSFINRNRIRIGAEPHWVTIPVRGSITASIREIEIDLTQNWKRQHLKTFQQYYAKAPGYARTLSMLEEVYTNDLRSLGEFNIELIRRTCQAFGITTPLMLSSAFEVDAARTDRLVALTREVGGTVYISGTGGKSYQDPDSFQAQGIGLDYLQVSLRPYPQQGKGFVPSLSVLDYLFNVGEIDSGILAQDPA